MIRNTLPQSLVDNPRLDQWIAFEPDRTVALKTGKVELGQGILTALRQIAAEELDLEPRQLKVVSGDTQLSPAEGVTAGSLSVEIGGGSIRLVCAEVRARMLESAAARLGADPAELSVEAGEIRRAGARTALDYWSLAGSVELSATATGSVPTKRPSEYRVVGRSEQRLDLPGKVFGAPFIHDMALPGMLHARIVHRPWAGARFASPDEVLARLAGPEVELIRDGDFLAFVSRDETACAAALGRAWQRLAWTGGEPLSPEHGQAAWLLSQPTSDRQIGPDNRPDPAAAFRLDARYSRPYLAHGSIGPSCAVALFAGGRLNVWTHSQGVGPLRASLAQVLELAPDHVVVHHQQGAGCYGHNGADDVALDAALVAVARPGVPIRVMWMREDELSSSPFGAAMIVEIDAGCEADGRVLDWTLTVTSPTHVSRPGAHGEVHLLSSEALARPWPRPDGKDFPDERGGGASRNSLALYDLPPQRIVHRLVPKLPVRTSALRGLGALANVFAIESAVDEIAERAGRDPVAYRLSMLSDPRGRRVIERAAEMAGWQPGLEGGTGMGRGIAFSRYKNHAAYAAIVAEVEVDEEVRVRRLWATVDAGLVINPDGAANQIEGGIIQAVSWATQEEVRFEDGCVATSTWNTYPILRFSQVPDVEIALVGDPNDPPLGLGEVSLGPTAAAIGNAVAHALGIRMRDLPLTRDRILAAMEAG
ncbi:molybdopterin cofactor-binding domain-containing protein [uncultured Enterovirga sp.]|uniref:xanthine dehydrogenase family protein molybdopterin-binding subunit n=1 Tax=uncultured Enterovirga sp. TaxID=2026352 RepID=UPI0035CA705E